MPSKRKAKGDDAGESPPFKVPKIEGVELLRNCLKAVYGLDFPDDLFMVWECAGEVDPKDPLNAFQPLGLQLVGPFEILASRSFTEKGNPHLHYRYPYDPPEFMTTMIQPARHFGYFRDDPTALPVLVASGTAMDYRFTIEGDTLIAVLWQLCKSSGCTTSTLQTVLSKKMELYGVKPTDVRKVRTARQKQSLGEPFHGMGLLVPYDPKTEVGYRELSISTAKFKTLLQKVVSKTATPADRTELDTILTFVDVANDECDFGHGLEVGLDLYAMAGVTDQEHDPLHPHCLRILDLAYMLLGRALFQSILQAHMVCRCRDPLAQPME